MDLVLQGSDGQVLCRRCMLADNPLTRARGLMGRTDLAADEGMFIATRAIHTWFMRFPIDVVFLDGENTVVDVVHSLDPWRFAVRWRARSVVELRAGACEALGLEAGARLELRPPTADDDADATGNGEIPRPLRVAIASDDGRFRRVSSFLLARHGYDVTAYKRFDDLPGGREPRDVVVLDGTSSLAAAARAVLRISAAQPATGVVVVADAAQDEQEMRAIPRTLDVVPKWESFDRLAEAIREAAVNREHA